METQLQSVSVRQSCKCTSACFHIRTVLTDPDEDLLLLLGLFVRAVFLAGGFVHSARAHAPSPPTKQLDSLGQRRPFVPAVLLEQTKEAG